MGFDSSFVLNNSTTKKDGHENSNMFVNHTNGIIVSGLY